ncbi:MAG: fibrobacter succinogenes major paralogous domain-containing protein [Candidatus Fibromonas sp.]|jgi:uncharacterized protein (TIGR02145 family)|nr:fibrobacter succinogenes major paralogous domain-containing protein [Candidatus Fibromonas sp.]
MNRVKALWAMCIFALAVAVVLGCSDSGEGPNLPSGNETGDKSENAAGKTNDGHDLLVFDHGILDEILFKTDTVYITDTSFLGRLYFRNLPANKTPEPGDIINSAITKKAPYGFLYRVAEVTKEEENVTIVSVGYASIAEAVKDLDIEFEVPLVYDDEDVAGDVLAKSWFQKLVKKVVNTVVQVWDAVVDFVSGNWEAGGTNNLTIEVIDKKASFGDNKNYSGEVKLNGKYVLTLNMKLKTSNYNLDYAKMSVAQEKDLKLEGNLKGKITYKQEYDLARFTLPDISFWAGPVFVYLANTGIVKAKVEAQAEAKISAELSFKEYSEFGFEYSGGRWTKIDVSGKDFGFDYKHSIYGSARLGVLVGFRSLFFGVGGLEVSAGPSVLLKTPDLLNFAADPNVTLDVDLDVDMKVRFQFLDWLQKSYDFGEWSVYLGNLSRSKALSAFDSLVASNIGVSYTEIKSAIERPNFGFQVENYGVCIGKSEKECENGGGTRQSFGAINDDKKHEFTASFSDLSTGTYYARTYFESGIEGDIHYDKATVFEIRPPDLVDPRDGQVYKTTIIGTQTWMAQNLNYAVKDTVLHQYGECFGEDRSIHIEREPNNLSDAEVEANCAMYGRLYSSGSIVENDVCPAGWHVPNDEEWQTLFDFVGGSGIAGEKLKAVSGWNYGNGTDDYGFAALPGGNYNQSINSGGNYSFIGERGYWWSASSNYPYYGTTYVFMLMTSLEEASREGFTVVTSSYMFSVRCLKD